MTGKRYFLSTLCKPVAIALLCLGLSNAVLSQGVNDVLDLRSVAFSAEGRLSMDDQWQFALEDGQSFTPSELGNLGKGQALQWRTVDLPHDWSIEGHISATNPMGPAGGYFPAGKAWYRKSMMIPAAWQDKGKRLQINFGGVYMNSTVYINGKALGSWPYGYSSFYYDLSPYLKYGKENEILISVDNSQQISSRWYSGSGIYRHVYLSLTDKCYLPEWGVAVHTRMLSYGAAEVELSGVVENESAYAKTVQVVTDLSYNGKVAAKDKTDNIEVAANSKKRWTKRIVLKDAKLWRIDAPHLYTADLRLVEVGSNELAASKLLQRTSRRFGVRSIAYSAEKGFLLNGQQVKMNGACVHSDNGCLGVAAFDKAEQRKVRLLKEAGFNAVRTSHNPPSTAFLDACDSIGLLVIDEAFDGWRTEKNKYDYHLYFDQWWKKDLDAMVLRDQNHPSIIMWSIGNEIIERKSPEAVRTAKMLAAEVHRLDSSRPVTSAMTTWDKEWAIFDPLMAAHDIAGYNYQLHRAADDHKRVPSRMIVQTESYAKDVFKNWALVEDNPYIIGDFIWTGMDYLGESSIGRYIYPGEQPGQHWEGDFFPWHGAYCGDINLLGERKAISHYRNVLFGSEKLYMAVKEPSPADGAIKLTSWAVWPTWPSWAWPEMEGKPLEVEVYSRYPKVRLYLNNQLVGEKTVGLETEFKAVFKLPYKAGTLKAVGGTQSADGSEKEVVSTTLQTAGAVSDIHLAAEQPSVLADGQNLVYVQVALQDKNGVLNPNADNLLKFSVSGPGKIIGVDNGNLQDPAPYQADTRKAWKGRAMVVIRTEKQPGSIHLKVSAEGLDDKQISVRAL